MTSHRIRKLSLALALGFVLAVFAGASTIDARPTALPASLRIPTDLIKKQPDLIFAGDPTKMKIVWQLSATGASTLEWGADTTYALGSQITSEYGTDHQHTYTIDQLIPAHEYYYRLTAGGPSYKGSFFAAPTSDAADLKFLAYGDTRTNTAEHNIVAGAMMSDCAADSAYQSLILCVGDLVADGNTESYWTNEFFNPTYTNIRKVTANLPYQCCMGNHEGTGTLFVKYFPYPFQAARYWSFDYGPIHVSMVDQYTSYGAGSAQLQWLTDDLRNSTKPWKFIVLHEPGWSAGGGHENSTTVQNYIQPLCLQYGVSIVFGGHNHYYARAEVNGIEHLTTGGGGAPLYTPNPSYPYIVATARAYHYCRIQIRGGSLDFQAVTPSGTILDSFHLLSPMAVEGMHTGPMTILGSAHPNPFSSETVIDWSLPPGSRSDLVILDVRGRQIRRFPLLDSGRQSVRWDGADQRGRQVESGVYYYRLDPNPGSRSQGGKLLLLR